MGRDESDESIKEEKNLTGKIQYQEYELQVSEDKYLLSGLQVWINWCFFASVEMRSTVFYTYEKD